jgi:hypothetical protein
MRKGCGLQINFAGSAFFSQITWGLGPDWESFIVLRS